MHEVAECDYCGAFGVGLQAKHLMAVDEPPQFSAAATRPLPPRPGHAAVDQACGISAPSAFYSGENLVSSLRQRRSMTQPRYIPNLSKPDKHVASSDASLWSNVLATVPLFAGLSRRHLNKVASAGRIARFYHQTAIVRAGEPGDTLYVVLDGEVSVRRPAGPELTLGIGSFFGEISLLDGGPVRRPSSPGDRLSASRSARRASQGCSAPNRRSPSRC